MTDSGVVWLRAGAVRVGVAPRLGGRMLSLEFGGHEYLWRNPSLVGPDLRPLVDPVAVAAGSGFDAWQNWGGEKTWPAPQGWSGPGEWPGPPDAVLDGGAYRVLAQGPRRVILESAYDDRTGLRIRREIVIEADESVTVTATMTNESWRRVRWAAWEVAQLAFDANDVGNPGSGVLVDVSGDRRPLVLFAPLGEIHHSPATAVPCQPLRANGDSLAGAVVGVPFADVVGKIGFPDASGCVRFRRSGLPDLLLDFAVDAGAPYPDGCPFQLWMQTDHDGPLQGLEGLEVRARLVELEPVSPLTDLAPGESVTLITHWRVVMV